MSEKKDEIKKPTCTQCGEELVEKRSPGFCSEKKLVCPEGHKQNQGPASTWGS
jgi:formylmethanofuran dehydrogenase subunit E